MVRTPMLLALTLVAPLWGAVGVATAAAEIPVCASDSTAPVVSFNVAESESPALESDRQDAEALSPALDPSSFSVAPDLTDSIPQRRPRPPAGWCFSANDPRCHAEPGTPGSAGVGPLSLAKATVSQGLAIGGPRAFHIRTLRVTGAPGPDGVRDPLLRPPR